MKKVFVIFSMAGCLSLVNGINNANALSDEPVITLNYTCPEGCTLQLVSDNENATFYLQCTSTRDGLMTNCGDPNIGIGTTNATLNLNDYNIIGVPANASVIDAKKIKKQTKPVSARSAETPKMVKKIVYEQVMEDEE